MAGWPSRQSPGVSLGIVLVALAAAGGIALVVARSFDHSAPADRTLAELRGLPLVGLVMKQEPAVEARLRAAIDEELRDPTSNGPSRVFVAIGDLRRSTIGPALASADDSAATDVLKARVALVAHLQKTDLVACREFAGDGVRRVDELDATGQRLFRDVLSAMEAAYRSGRASASASKPVANDAEFVAMLGEGGLSQADIHELNAGPAMSDADLCDLKLKIDATPSKLPSAKRGAFARYMLTH